MKNSLSKKMFFAYFPIINFALIPIYILIVLGFVYKGITWQIIVIINILVIISINIFLIVESNKNKYFLLDDDQKLVIHCRKYKFDVETIEIPYCDIEKIIVEVYNPIIFFFTFLPQMIFFGGEALPYRLSIQYRINGDCVEKHIGYMSYSIIQEICNRRGISLKRYPQRSQFK